MANFGQLYRFKAVQQNIDYSDGGSWLKFVPLADVIYKLMGIPNLPEAVSYKFEQAPTTLISDYMISANEQFGYFGI